MSELIDIAIYAAGLYAVVGLLVLWRHDPKHFSPFRWFTVLLRVVFSLILWPVVRLSTENSRQKQTVPVIDEETIDED